MRGNQHSCPSHHLVPPNADFLISPDAVHVSDDASSSSISSAAVKRSEVLVQAQRNADGTPSRVPTGFAAEQIQLWAFYTRAPRLVRAHGQLYTLLAVLEVADMLNDATSVAQLCQALADDYLASLQLHPSDAQAREQSCTKDALVPADQQRLLRSHDRAVKAKPKARCRKPAPCLHIQHAFLWGTGLGTSEILRGGRPEGLDTCCDAMKQEHTRASKLKPVARREAVWRALEALPEHLLLRVLRASPAPLATQLAVLPRRLHPAAVAAAHPSVDASRSISLELPPQPLRCALRAVAALGSMRRVDSVTVAPPGAATPSARSTQQQRADGYLDALRFAAGLLRGVSAVTALYLTEVPQCQLEGMGGHPLWAMPHLRALGLAGVRQKLLPQLVPMLGAVQQLQELHLELVCVLPALDGGCRWGAAVAIQELFPLTALQAVKLKILYKHVYFARDTVPDERRMHACVAHLRALEGKRVTFGWQSFTVSGTRQASDVLGTLRAAAPGLDFAQCAVEESWEGTVGRPEVTPEVHAALWAALMTGSSGGDDGGFDGGGPHNGGPDAGLTLTVTLARAAADLQFDPMNGCMDVPPALLGTLRTLEQLSVPRDLLLDRGSAAALGRELHALTRLTCLVLNEVLQGGFAAQLLLPRLSRVTALQELELEGNCLGERGAAALAEGLPRLAALTALQLEQNDIGGDGAAAVVAALAPAAAAGLVRLDLSWNRIGLPGAAALAARLPEMTSLRELGLGANNLAGAEGVRALLRGLVRTRTRLPALTELGLERNMLECAGVAEVAGVLPRFPRLQALDLQSNAVAHPGMHALVRRLPHMLCLNHVLLNYNCIGDVGARVLARMLRMHHCPQHVLAAGGSSSTRPDVAMYSLEHNGISDVGATALADAVLGPYERRGGAARSAQRVAVKLELQRNDISARMWRSVSQREERLRRRGGGAHAYESLVCSSWYNPDRHEAGDWLHWMMDA